MARRILVWRWRIVALCDRQKLPTLRPERIEVLVCRRLLDGHAVASAPAADDVVVASSSVDRIVSRTNDFHVYREAECTDWCLLGIRSHKGDAPSEYRVNT